VNRVAASTAGDLAQYMAAVAKELLGEPNPVHSKKGEPRYGTNGSLKVDLAKGTFYDFEAEKGGGVIDFIIHRNVASDKKSAAQWMRDKGILPNTGDGGDEIIATFSYTDEAGEELFQVVRYEPKDFRQRRQGPDGWVWNVRGVRQVVYRLPELEEALAMERTIFIVEGEGKVDLLLRWNVPATCNAGGSKKWRAEHAEFLRDADVIIMGDNDQAGRDHVETVGKSLVGIASSIRVLHLPGLPPKGDIINWAKTGGTADKLWKLVEAESIPWTPQPVQLLLPWWRDPVTIPPREKLYGDHYSRRTIGATIGAGGRAKTTLGILEAVSMAIGRDLLTGQPIPSGPLRVMMWNGEEDQDELDRRVAAVCQHYKITRDDLGGRLFVLSVLDDPMRIAVIEKGLPKINDDTLGRMIKDITDNHIDVFMVDPLVSFHRVTESLNEHMEVVIKDGFTTVARKTNSAGEIFHHPGKPKPGQAETTVEDGRGASGIIWAVRSARVLNFMTTDEAERLGIAEDERRLHIRITNGKANMGPIGKAHWIKICVEDLPNGDRVACASSWKPENPFQNVTTTHMHKCRALAQTGAYRADSRAANWIGYAVAEIIGINIAYRANNDPKDLAKVKEIIKTWLKNRVFAIDKREDKDRKEREFIIPGSWKPEPTTAPDNDEVIAA